MREYRAAFASVRARPTWGIEGGRGIGLLHAPERERRMVGAMGTILDLNPRLQEARRARGWGLVLVPDLTDLAVVNLQLALLPLLVIVDALAATRPKDPTR